MAGPRKDRPRAVELTRMTNGRARVECYLCGWWRDYDEPERAERVRLRHVRFHTRR